VINQEISEDICTGNFLIFSGRNELEIGRQTSVWVNNHPGFDLRYVERIESKKISATEYINIKFIVIKAT